MDSPASPADFDRLFTVAYDELRQIASRHLRHEQPGHTLETTALVHEAYVKLAARQDFPRQESARFKALVSKAMRQILIDHARARAAEKRGGAPVQVTLDPAMAASESRPVDLLDLDRALIALAERDPRLDQIVECLFFGGMTKEETGEALGMSSRTVERDWVRAKAYLRRLLEPAAPS